LRTLNESHFDSCSVGGWCLVLVSGGGNSGHIKVLNIKTLCSSTVTGKKG